MTSFELQLLFSYEGYFLEDTLYRCTSNLDHLPQKVRNCPHVFAKLFTLCNHWRMAKQPFPRSSGHNKQVAMDLPNQLAIGEFG